MGDADFEFLDFFFDEEFYLAQNPDVAAAVAAGDFESGRAHFIAFGAVELRNPNPFFDTANFVLARAGLLPTEIELTGDEVAGAIADFLGDAADAGLSAAAFIGRSLGFLGGGALATATPLFDADFYVNANPSVAADLATGNFGSAFEHFLSVGLADGLVSTPIFDEAAYLAANPEAAAAVAAGGFDSGFEQFAAVGRFDPDVDLPGFGEAAYLIENADVAAAVAAGDFASALDHFIRFGQLETGAREEQPSLNLTGAGAADLLIGSSGEDTLDGAGGADELRGGFGDDLLIGGGGNDLLIGGPGDDILRPGGGGDVIFGGDVDFDIIASSGGFNEGLNALLRIDGLTGEFLGVFADGSTNALLNDPRDVVLDGPFGALDTTILVNVGFAPPAEGNDFTLRFDQDGAFIENFIDLGDSGVFVNPGGAVFGPGGNFFVGSRTTGTVFEFDGETGAFIENAGTGDLGGFFDPADIDFARGFVFLPNGDLVIGNGSNPSTGEGEDQLLLVDADSRAVTVLAAPDGFSPLDVILSPDGTRIVVSSEFPFTGGSLAAAGPGSIFVFDAQTGDVVQQIDPGLDPATGEPFLLAPRGLGFGPDGTLFSSSTANGDLLAFDIDNGLFLGVVAQVDGLNGQAINFILPEDFDTLAGGNDTVSFEDLGFAVDVDLRDGLADYVNGAGAAVQDVLIGIENLIGTQFDDRLFGNGVANVLSGLGGDDLFHGFGGIDSFDGGEGSDTVTFNAAPGGVTLDLRQEVQANGETFVSIENLTGSQFDDVIVGDDGANVLNGQNGDDALAGGGGADVFVFSAAASGNDAITDFEDGVDIIAFEGVLAFADLTIAGDGGDALVSFDGGSIRLEGVAAADLTAADFDFETGAASVLDSTLDLLV